MNIDRTRHLLERYSFIGNKRNLVYTMRALKKAFLFAVLCFFTFVLPAQTIEKLEGIDYFGVDWNSISHKNEVITVSQPLVIKFKAKPANKFLLFFSAEEGKTPKGFVQEVKSGQYELHIIPRSAGEFYCDVYGMELDLNAEEDELPVLEYEMISTQGHSFFDYIRKIPLKPSPAFYNLGFTNADLPFSKMAVNAKGSFLPLEIQSKNNNSLLQFLILDEDKASLEDFNYGIDRRTIGTLIAHQKGWVQISLFYTELDESGEEKDDSYIELVTYWVYFSEVTSVKTFLNKKYFSSVEPSFPIEQEDYTAIDKHVKNIPASKNTSLKSIVEYIELKATTDKEKARGAYRWIRENITYANTPEGVPDHSQPTEADYVVEGKRKTVCAGYAAVFKGMMYLMNIYCFYIGGYVLDSRFTVEKPGLHAWNAVKIDNEWQLVDATWSMFLTPPTKFILSHYPNYVNEFSERDFVSKLQCLPVKLSLSEFKQRDYSRIFKGDDISLHQGLVAHYDFDGTINNIEGANYIHARFTAQYATDRFGKAGKALKLTGNTFTIDPQKIEDFSFSTWVYIPKNDEKYKEILSLKNEAGKHIFMFGIDDANMPFLSHQDTKSNGDEPLWAFAKEATPKRWQHVVVVKKGKTITLYMNTRDGFAAELTTTITYPFHKFYVGSSQTIIGLDDLRIYNRALSKNEIGKLFYEKGYKGKFGDHY